ncbi:hypothetical protein D3C80_1461240 [compost metagenome]
MQLFHFLHHVLVKQLQLLIQPRPPEKELLCTVGMAQMVRVPVDHILIPEEMGREIIVVMVNSPFNQMTDGIIHIDGDNRFSHSCLLSCSLY